MRHRKAGMILLLYCVFSMSGCKQDETTQSGGEIGFAALKDYCLSDRLTVDDFEQARIYAEAEYDVCIEYVTRSNVVPKHVLILFVKDGRIVERHRDIQNAPIPR